MSAAAENVIGGILVNGKDAYWRVADLLRPEDFPTARLANLYRICSEVAKGASDLDVFSVGEAAERQGVENAAAVVGIASNTWNLGNLRGHAEQVKADAVDRRFRAICAEGAKTGDVAKVQADMGALLSSQPAHAVPAADALKRMWDGVLARYASREQLSGLPTGIPLLDEWTGGLQAGRVYGIGARAKMGKTVLAMNICARLALAGKHVAVWSLEMTDEELMQRMACAVAGVPSMLLQCPWLLDDEDEAARRFGDKAYNAMTRLSDAISQLRDSKLVISDRMDVTAEDIEAQARQMREQGELDLLCTDHLGLMKLPKMDRHDLAVGHVTRRHKKMAKELGIPVIPVFQLNRGNENGQIVRPPRPSDARDSGNIEQDVDAMILLHRPSYYDKSAAKGLRLDLALQRNGQTGLIRMGDELDCCRFTGGTEEWVDSKTASGGRDDDL